jgi:hypothetical protein
MVSRELEGLSMKLKNARYGPSSPKIPCVFLSKLCNFLHN